jgi:hypothetical protein
MSNKAYYYDDDIKETLRIPQTPDLEEEGWLTKVRYLFPPERIFQTQVLKVSAPLRSPLGALALPYKVPGSVITPNHPSEGALQIFEALALRLSLLGSVIAP